MEELVQLITKTYGLVGLLILAPMAALTILYKDHRKMLKDREKQDKEWEERIGKVQEQRVQDAQAITAKLVEIVSEQSGLNRETNMALERISEMLDKVGDTLQRLLERK